MQQTEKFKLNLIEGSDTFSPEPLNDNAVKTEQALTAHRAQVEGALEAQAADTAAQFAALPRLHIQSWTGNGADTRVITFPFQPRVVILSQAYFSSAGTVAVLYGQEQAYRLNGNGGSEVLKLTWSGTTLSMTRNYYNAPVDILLNAEGKTYFSVAFQ